MLKEDSWRSTDLQGGERSKPTTTTFFLQSSWVPPSSKAIRSLILFVSDQQVNFCRGLRTLPDVQTREESSRNRLAGTLTNCSCVHCSPFLKVKLARIYKTSIKPMFTTLPRMTFANRHAPLGRHRRILQSRNTAVCRLVCAIRVCVATDTARLRGCVLNRQGRIEATVSRFI